MNDRALTYWDAMRHYVCISDEIYLRHRAGLSADDRLGRWLRDSLRPAACRAEAAFAALEKFDPEAAARILSDDVLLGGASCAS